MDWDTPRWRQEGRTGPGPIAPQYASRKDRATVRKGGEVAAKDRWIPDPKPAGGALPKSNHGRKPLAPGPHSNRGGDCCPMVAAVRAVRRGRFRLARRYAAWSVRLLVARVA